MTARDFCYWLQGFFEIHTGKHATRLPELTVDQVDLIARHLSMVFAHEIDPSAGGTAVQQKLSHLHSGTEIRC